MVKLSKGKTGKKEYVKAVLKALLEAPNNSFYDKSSFLKAMGYSKSSYDLQYIRPTRIKLLKKMAKDGLVDFQYEDPGFKKKKTFILSLGSPSVEECIDSTIEATTQSTELLDDSTDEALLKNSIDTFMQVIGGIAQRRAVSELKRTMESDLRRQIEHEYMERFRGWQEEFIEERKKAQVQEESYLKRIFGN